MRTHLPAERPVVAPEPAGRPVEPLGPDSLMWKYNGDQRGFLLGLWAGSMQNMYPALGAGVDEHSQFFTERWARLRRSVYPILGCVFDGPRAEQTAHEIRDYHRTIKGVDEHGQRYSALDPDTFFWAHATFILTPILVHEYFGRPLREAEKEQLYQEGIQWWRLYGLSMRPVPPDWHAFLDYVADVCANQLEVNQATLDVLDLRNLPAPPELAWLPDPIWAVLRLGVHHGYNWLATGIYPQTVRVKLGRRWTRRDELALRVLGRGIALGWRLVPERARLHPRAYQAWQRVRGEIPADSPPVEAPARYLPPPAERGRPTHYCPVS